MYSSFIFLASNQNVPWRTSFIFSIIILQDPSPDSSFNVSVSDETVDLISRVADLQQEKWQLEERVRYNNSIFINIYLFIIV